jgi:hypothetical protein
MMCMIRYTALGLVALMLYGGCTPRAHPSAEVITVEGPVSVWGAEPFTAQVLQTAGQNYYVLVFERGERPYFSIGKPFRVTGQLYRDTWNTSSLAHLRVTSFEEVP